MSGYQRATRYEQNILSSGTAGPRHFYASVILLVTCPVLFSAARSTIRYCPIPSHPIPCHPIPPSCNRKTTELHASSRLSRSIISPFCPRCRPVRDAPPRVHRPGTPTSRPHSWESARRGGSPWDASLGGTCDGPCELPFERCSPWALRPSPTHSHLLFTWHGTAWHGMWEHGDEG